MCLRDAPEKYIIIMMMSIAVVAGAGCSCCRHRAFRGEKQGRGGYLQSTVQSTDEDLSFHV